MKTSLITCLIFYLIFQFSPTNTNKEWNHYPTITWKMKVYDKKTKEAIKGLTCEREVYYENVYCQPFMLSSIDKIMLYEKQLKDNLYYKGEDSIKIKESIEEERAVLNQLLKQNEIPIIDTIKIDTFYFFTLRNPVLSYKVTLKHPDYKTVLIDKKFDKCTFDINLEYGMEKKDE